MPEAVHEIFKISNGTPRLINILCDRALITGYIRELNRVSPETIRECAKELDTSSGDETTDIRIEPQIEKSAAIEEKTDQARRSIKPFIMKRKWIPAAVMGTVVCLLFGVFFIRVPPESKRWSPLQQKSKISKIRQSIRADPKGTAPALTRMSDIRQSQNPPDRGLEKSSVGGAEKVKKQIGAFEKPVTATLPQVSEPPEKEPLKDLFSELPPEQPTGIDQSVGLRPKNCLLWRVDIKEHRIKGASVFVLFQAELS